MQIVQLSDIHIGGLYVQSVFDTVVEEVNKLKPDAIIVTGDLTDDGLLIPIGKLPYSIINDITNAVVTLKSSSSSFKELEYPDFIEERAGGLMIILDPKPAIAESFKVTIS